MLALLLFVANPTVTAAHAGDYVVGVGDTTEVGSRGNWGRLYDRDGGYWFLIAGGGDYIAYHLDEDYEVDESSRTELTGWDTLVDHAFTACPDGTWLHVASANIDDYDDSAYIFRYDEDMVLTDQATIAESDGTHTYNDAPVICTGDFNGSPFQPDDLGEGPFYWYDDDLELVSVLDFPESPPVGGSSLVQEDDGTIAWIMSDNSSSLLKAVRYTDPSTESSPTELDPIEAVELDPLDDLGELDSMGDDGITYWPQSVIRVGDYWLLAHVGRDDTLAWTTDSGNIYVQVYDLDWEWVDGMRITDYSGGDGAMQPFLHWTPGSETIQVMYSVNVQNTLTEISVSADALGFDSASVYGPVADAGSDQTLPPGSTVYLDGSSSSDPDGDPLTYIWGFDSTPGPSILTDADIDGASSPVASFEPDAQGVFVVQLGVSDGTFTDWDRVEINIDPDSTGDGGATDGGATDGGATDGGATDGGATDGGATDGGATDGGSSDGGATDGGSSDGGATDGGATDGGADGGGTDTGGEGKDEGCGCAGSTAPASLMLAWMPLLLAVRRRRDTPAA